MIDTQIANYAFIDFYYNKSKDKTLDLNKPEDRLRIVLKIFTYSEINSNHKNKSLFDDIVEEFYQVEKSENIIFSQELSKLFNFIIKKMGIKIMESEPRDMNLVNFLGNLVDIYEDIIKATEHELYDQFEDANNLWKKIFGDDFPNFDEKLKDKYLKDNS